MILAPAIKWLFTALVVAAIKPRESSEPGGAAPLDTQDLDALARSATPSTAASSQSSASVPVGPSASADGQTAYLTEAEVERLLSPSPLRPVASGTSTAPSTAGAASVPVDTEAAAREALAREALARETPTLAGDVLDSPVTAARKLHTLATTVPSAQRGPHRAFIRAMQAIIGVQADGLIGRQTAARVRELTGLTIPV